MAGEEGMTDIRLFSEDDTEETEISIEFIVPPDINAGVWFIPEEVGTRDLIRFLEDTILTLRRVH